MTQAEGVAVIAEGGSLIVSVPLAMKRRSGRKEVIAPEGTDGIGGEEARTNRALALTLARAHRWRKLLEEGRYSSIRELALAVGADNSYVARLLRLTLVAPDIVEAVLMGTEPDGLSLEKLFRVPVAWEEQRRAVRMPGAGDLSETDLSA